MRCYAEMVKYTETRESAAWETIRKQLPKTARQPEGTDDEVAVAAANPAPTDAISACRVVLIIHSRPNCRPHMLTYLLASTNISPACSYYPRKA